MGVILGSQITTPSFPQIGVHYTNAPAWIRTKVALYVGMIDRYTTGALGLRFVYADQDLKHTAWEGDCVTLLHLPSKKITNLDGET